ncbi:MAG: Holliday junction branch migration protein RuvA [Oscillospiraceae bacterium]|nr:Holliday junction branch migration protein RuvA [Oscillospiraceae bacterium]
MFHYISGTVAAMDHNLAVIDANGVGYALSTTSTSQADLKVGEPGKLYTYNVIREDCFDLYGFSTLVEKRCFEQLISVSGVGPKAALAILSSTTPEGLAMSILAEDEKTIMVAQGVGKKIAQRVILELKDKMGKNAPAFVGGGVKLPAGAVPGGTNRVMDATAALAVLGYSQGEIALALRDIDVEGHQVEQIIKLALKKMGRAI